MIKNWSVNLHLQEFDMEKLLEISEYLTTDSIIDLQSDEKTGAIKELISVIKNNPNITNPELFEKAIFNREKLMSTGIR